LVNGIKGNHFLREFMFNASLGINCAHEAKKKKNDQNISVQCIHHIFNPPRGNPAPQPVMNDSYGHNMMQYEEGRNELTKQGSNGDVTGCFSVDPARDKNCDSGQEGDDDNQYREMFNHT
jgi:hypothetical protein